MMITPPPLSPADGTNVLTLVFDATIAVVLTAAVPAVLVLVREISRRVRARVVRSRVAAATATLARTRGEPPERVAAALREAFAPGIIDRAVIAALRASATDDDARARLTRVAEHAGLVTRFAGRLREASGWRARQEAAQVLGVLGLSSTVPALVAALRDPDEDVRAVKIAAAEALGTTRDPAAVAPLLAGLEPLDEVVAPHIAEALAAIGAPALEPLVAAVERAGEPGVRAWHLRALGQLGDPRALPTLLAALGNDPHEVARVAAATVLASARDAAEMVSPALLAAALRDPAAAVRAAAAEALGQLRAPGTAQSLAATLRDPDPQVRANALEALAAFGPEHAAQLAHLLLDPVPSVARRAALLITRTGILGDAVEDLASEDAPRAARASALLVDLGRAGMAQAVARYASDGAPAARAGVLRALGEIGDAAVAPTLVTALGAAEPAVRAAAATALAQLGAPDPAPPALLAALADETAAPEVRAAAATALARLSPERLAALRERVIDAAAARPADAVDRPLVELLGQLVDEPRVQQIVRDALAAPHAEVRAAAVAALAAGSRPSLTQFVVRMSDDAAEVRDAAIDALGELALPSALDVLGEALRGAPQALRERITDALARRAVDSHEALARLAELSRDADRDTALGAIWALGKTRDPGAVAALAPRLADPDAAVRASVAGALGKIDAPRVIELLVGALDDPDGRTRAAVINALVRQTARRDDVVSALAARLRRDPDPFVRGRIAVALAWLGGGAFEDEIERAASSASTRLPRTAYIAALALLGGEGTRRRAARLLASSDTAAAFRARLIYEPPEMRALIATRLGLSLSELKAQTNVLTEHDSLLVQCREALRHAPEPEARREAAVALRRTGGEAALRLLAEAVSADPDEGVRVAAVAGLAGFARGDEAARRALNLALADPAPAVRAAAAQALARAGSSVAYDALFEQLGGRSAQARLAAELTLARAFADDPGAVLARARAREADAPRIAAGCVRVLARIGGPSLAAALAELARSPVAEVRCDVIRASAALGTAEAAPLLALAVADPQPAARCAAVRVLTTVGTPAMVQRAAARLAADPATAVRRTYARMLARFRGQDDAVLPLLVPLAGDGRPEVAAAALASLIALGSEASLGAFASHWERADAPTRAALAREPRAPTLRRKLARAARGAADKSARARLRSAALACGWKRRTPRTSRVVGAPSPPARAAIVPGVARGA